MAYKAVGVWREEAVGMASTYLSVTELSDYLKLPEETVYKYARTGRIPASKVGRYWRFEQSKVDRWVEEHSNQVPRRPKIAVVDDDPAVRSILERWLREDGCDPAVFAGGDEFVESLRSEDYDLLLLDLMMPAPNGVQTLQSVRMLRPSLDVVIVTAFFDTRLMDEALELGPLTILKKPVERESLQHIVANLAVKPQQAIS